MTAFRFSIGFSLRAPHRVHLFEQGQNFRRECLAKRALARVDRTGGVVNLAGAVAFRERTHGSLNGLVGHPNLCLKSPHLLPHIPFATFRPSFVELLHCAPVVPGRIRELMRRGRLLPLELQKRLQFGVAFQVADYTLQYRVSVNRTAMTLLEPKQKLLLGVIEFPPPVQTIIINRLPWRRSL